MLGRCDLAMTLDHVEDRSRTCFIQITEPMRLALKFDGRAGGKIAIGLPVRFQG
jgi:hypothetical protein